MAPFSADEQLGPSKNKKPTILAGVRVIEYGAFQQAPLATKWLAEAGAEVIKIEGLPGGDPMRGTQGAVSSGRSTDAPNWFYEYLNRNKKSVALNMSNDTSRQIIYRLIEKSDVFVSNLRTPTLKNYGIDYDTLSRLNPKLIYAQGTGYGLKGDDSDKPVLDIVGQARSGVLNFMGDLSTFAIVGNWTPCDKVSALQLAYGISLALLYRYQTGVGQMVDTSLMGAGIYLGAFELQYYVGSGELSPRLQRNNVKNPLRNIYKTKDNKWICLGMTQSDRYWPEFCKALGLEKIVHDERFVNIQSRAQNSVELILILDKTFAEKDRQQWEEILGKHNLIWSIVSSTRELAVDNQTTENGYLVPWSHQKLNEVRGIGPLIGLSEAPLSVGEPAPELGQNTEEVLLSIGYTWDELAVMKEAGVII